MKMNKSNKLYCELPMWDRFLIWIENNREKIYWYMFGFITMVGMVGIYTLGLVIEFLIKK